MIKKLINSVPDKIPEFRFTGNLFRRFPELLEYAPLSDKNRLNLILTPIQKSWYFEHDGDPFNFYPIFLKLVSGEKNYISVCRHVSIRDAEIMSKSNNFKNIQL